MNDAMGIGGVGGVVIVSIFIGLIIGNVIFVGGDGNNGGVGGV